ncbi:MAG: right-handed parallel beta-helix repeat-containing protein [Archaeoglobus sp.]|nr:right-handed parallel beta-helix repeat-containing protein [Archaeoglobus sp.]
MIRKLKRIERLLCLNVSKKVENNTETPDQDKRIFTPDLKREIIKELLKDPEFKETLLKELEYRTGRRDFLKVGALGLMGFALGIGSSMPAGGDQVLSDTISDYTGTKIPKPCSAIISQDGTGDYDVLPNEDASEVIQKTINEVAKIGGGKILIREGTYLMYNPIRLFDNITFQGMGFSTILKLMREISKQGLITNKKLVDGNRNIIIRDLLIDVNFYPRTSGIFFNAKYGAYNEEIIIQNVKCINAGYHGFAPRYTRYTLIINCIAENNAFNGFDTLYCEYLTLDNCISIHNTNGIDVAKPSKNISIQNSLIKDNNDRGLIITTNFNRAIGCEIAGNNSEGVTISGAYNQIANSSIHHNGESGIRVTASRNCTAHNNKIYSNRFGIILNSGESHSITLNEIWDNKTGVILDDVGKCFVFSNIIFDQINGPGIRIQSESNHNLIMLNHLFNKSGLQQIGIYETSYPSNNHYYFNHCYNNLKHQMLLKGHNPVVK